VEHSAQFWEDKHASFPDLRTQEFISNSDQIEEKMIELDFPPLTHSLDAITTERSFLCFKDRAAFHFTVILILKGLQTSFWIKLF
jgi:hypothetical protein